VLARLESWLGNLNHPEARAVGIPGGGGIAAAAALALFYQGLLAGKLVSRDFLDEIARPCVVVGTNELGLSPRRGLGVMTAAGDAWRGIGNAAMPRAFGHDGAGGHLGWCDPDSGISLAYVTNGFDRNTFGQWRRGAQIAATLEP